MKIRSGFLCFVTLILCVALFVSCADHVHDPASDDTGTAQESITTAPSVTSAEEEDHEDQPSQAETDAGNTEEQEIPSLPDNSQGKEPDVDHADDIFS